MEWFKYRPAVVKGSPYYRRASAAARLAYLESIGDLWCAAVASGVPALPPDAIEGCDELLASKLAVETARGVEIPWVTDLWEHEHAYREGQRSHGGKRSKNAHMRGYPEGSLKHPEGASVCLSDLSSPDSSSGTPERARARKGLRVVAPPGFERFWAAYPSKTGKTAALSAWQKHQCEARTDQIVAKVEQLVREDSKWLEGYVKNPATWLNQGGWDDEPRRALPMRQAGPPTPQKSATMRGSEAAARELGIAWRRNP